MSNLTSAERRALRARAHHLHPVVMIGEAGLTPAVLREIDLALKSHELIKVRALGDDRGHRKSLIGDICNALAAQPVQRIGKILVVFRPRPKPAAPPDPPRRKRHRPKRHFQNR
jgi:RNA-binding protein